MKILSVQKLYCMQHKILKYLLDIESVILEIEAIKIKSENNFANFKSDIILQRAIERDLEIIGEAIRKIWKLNQAFKFLHLKTSLG